MRGKQRANEGSFKSALDGLVVIGFQCPEVAWKEQGSSASAPCSQAAHPGGWGSTAREAENRLGRSWRVVYLSDAITVEHEVGNEIGSRNVRIPENRKHIQQAR